MKRRKFTSWLTDPNDEGIIDVPNRVKGLPSHRYKVTKDGDGIRIHHMLMPPMFLMPKDTFAKHPEVIGFDDDLTEEERYQDYLSTPEP